MSNLPFWASISQADTLNPTDRSSTSSNSLRMLTDTFASPGRFSDRPHAILRRMPSAVTTPASQPPSASLVQSRFVVASVSLTVAWLAAYAPTIAGGFIKDDFGWIYHSRLTDWSSLYSVFANAQVFYR